MTERSTARAPRSCCPASSPWSRPRRAGRRAVPGGLRRDRDAWGALGRPGRPGRPLAAPAGGPVPRRGGRLRGGKRDLDRVCTAALDALQAGGAVRDDCLVDELQAVRHRLPRGTRPTTAVDLFILSGVLRSPERGRTRPLRRPRAGRPQGGQNDRYVRHRSRPVDRAGAAELAGLSKAVAYRLAAEDRLPGLLRLPGRRPEGAPEGLGSLAGRRRRRRPHHRRPAGRRPVSIGPNPDVFGTGGTVDSGRRRVSGAPHRRSRRMGNGPHRPRPQTTSPRPATGVAVVAHAPRPGTARAASTPGTARATGGSRGPALADPGGGPLDRSAVPPPRLGQDGARGPEGSRPGWQHGWTSTGCRRARRRGVRSPTSSPATWPRSATRPARRPTARRSSSPACTSCPPSGGSSRSG